MDLVLISKRGTFMVTTLHHQDIEFTVAMVTQMQPCPPVPVGVVPLGEAPPRRLRAEQGALGATGGASGDGPHVD